MAPDGLATPARGHVSGDLIAVLDRGRLVEFGTHAALLARGGTYAELFSLQARAYG